MECQTPTLKNGRINVDRYIVCFASQTWTYATVLMQASPVLVVRQVKFYKTILFLSKYMVLVFINISYKKKSCFYCSIQKIKFPVVWFLALPASTDSSDYIISSSSSRFYKLYVSKSLTCNWGNNIFHQKDHVKCL